MEETISVREYRPEDKGRVIEIVRDLQRHEGGLYDRMLPPSTIGAWYVNKQLQECTEGGGVILVAEYDGAVVGYASILMDVSSADDIDEVDYIYAYVNDLGVTQGMRGRGVGTALLTACEERARRADRKWFGLSVLAANTDALRLYRRLGFDPHIVLLEKRLD